MTFQLPEAFLPFLDSLTLEPRSANQAPIVTVCPKRSASTASGEQFTKPALALFQSEPTAVTLVGFRSKIVQRLREINHIASDELADAVLCLAVGAANTGSARARELSDLLAQSALCEVSHFLAFPHEAIKQQIRFDGYTLGPIAMPVLQSRCSRAHSDFYELYAKNIAGRFCIQSPDFRHAVISLIKIRQSGLLDGARGRDIVLNYFERLSRRHFDYMWEHLNRTQVLSAPFDSELIGVESFRRMASMLAWRITIYLDPTHRDLGYVVPENTAINLNQIDSADERVKQFYDHRTTYHLEEIGDSELGRALLEAALFCQQAIQFLESGRANDAALYATICLEQLFSETRSTAEAVSTRAAAVTHLRLAASFSDAEKELRKLYDARSSFVHAGQPVKPAQAERLIAYSKETLRSLLILHLKPENRRAGFLDQWVRNLDFIVKGFEAGKIFEPAVLADSGIFKP